MSVLRIVGLNLFFNYISRHCTDYQKRIVDDILTLSKIESGLITFVYRETNIVHMIEETLGMLKHLARSADVSLKVELHPTLTDNRLMELDSARVTQILINLVTNAIKVSPAVSSFKRSKRILKIYSLHRLRVCGA